MGRVVVVVVVSTLAVFVLATVAAADLTGGCTASVVIDGIAYGPDNDTPDNPIVVPDRSDVVAQWQGATPFANTNFRGEVGLVIGPTTVRLAEWSDPGDGSSMATGTYTRQELQDALPPGVKLRGLYELTGFHVAEAGRCDGRVFVRFGGNPLDNAVGIVAVAGLALSSIGLVMAGAARRA